MSVPPNVSVIMPARNAERWLSAAVQSVLDQTYGEFELLVIDDGSSDRTPAILDDLTGMDARLRILRQPPLGLVAALNAGLAAARGRYIARLDADDLASKNRLERQVACFEQNRDLVLLGSWAEKIDQSGRRVGLISPRIEPGKLKEFLLSKNPFVHSSVMFVTSTAREIGGYRAFFEAAEDFDLWIRLAERGEVAILPEILVKYRVHDEAVTEIKAVRQLFSTRLVLRSAAVRRSRRVDFAGQQAKPVDWWSVDEGSEFFDDAVVAQILQYSDPNNPMRPLRLADIRRGLRNGLGHRERRLAQVALFNLVRQRSFPFSARFEMALRAIALHPPRAIKLLFGGTRSDVT